MIIAPLIEASPAIQIHVAAMTVAVVCTPIQLLGRKGTPVHRASGWFWAAAMIIAALSSFFIHTIRVIGPFSPIHLLSILTLVSVPAAIAAARRGDIRRHRMIMIFMVCGAILGAGAFTLMPGRIMHEVFFAR
jgi:uncharacterized membrane protein